MVGATAGFDPVGKDISYIYPREAVVGRATRPRASQCVGFIFHGSRVTNLRLAPTRSVVTRSPHPAINRFWAKGHSVSIHWPSQRNPLRAANFRISSACDFLDVHFL